MFRFTITMSLDGYVAGPNQSEQHPLGIGGENLHRWLTSLAVFQGMHGEEGSGEVNASTPVVEEWWANAGATIMGRNMFGGGPGPWGDDEWRGWWGEDPPFHHPVFVLTHHARPPLEMGRTTFHFVTDGIGSALAQAQDAAGGKDVLLGGGAGVARQYLAASLLDELEISLVPLLLGGGVRLFDGPADVDIGLEQVRAVEAPGVTHIRYRVTSPGS